jgi:VanZ family protein
MVDVPVPLMTTLNRRSVVAANLAYAALLLLLGVLPGVPEIAPGVSDSAAHGIAYAGFAALLFVSFLPRVGKRKAAVVSVLGAIAYGGLVEALQIFQPARSVEIRDIVANSVGAVIAALVLYLVLGHRAGERDG